MGVRLLSADGYPHDGLGKSPSRMARDCLHSSSHVQLHIHSISARLQHRWDVGSRGCADAQSTTRAPPARSDEISNHFYCLLYANDHTISLMVCPPSRQHHILPEKKRKKKEKGETVHIETPPKEQIGPSQPLSTCSIRRPSSWWIAFCRIAGMKCSEEERRKACDQTVHIPISHRHHLAVRRTTTSRPSRSHPTCWRRRGRRQRHPRSCSHRT